MYGRSSLFRKDTFIDSLFISSEWREHIEGFKLFLSVRSSQVFELNNRRRLNKIDLQVINRRSKYFSDLKATTHFLPCKWYLLYQQEFFFLNLKNRLTCNYEITDTYYFLFIPQDTIMIVKVHSFKKKLFHFKGHYLVVELYKLLRDCWSFDFHHTRPAGRWAVQFSSR